MDTLFIVAQIVGCVALGLEIASFQCRKKDKILQFQILDAIFYLIHYLMLGGFSACITKILAITRSTCIIQKDKRRKNWDAIMWLFVVLYLIAGVLTFQAWYSILPLASGLLYTIITWKCKNPQIIRSWTILCVLLWAVYNVIICSIPGLCANAFVLVSLIVGLIRYKKPKRNMVK